METGGIEMNPYVSLEQAKRLKEAGYDQAVEKTDMHYVKTRENENIWLIPNIFKYWEVATERYAAPTVEEMMIAMGEGKESIEALDKAFIAWMWIKHGNEDLKEALVKAFEALKERS